MSVSIELVWSSMFRIICVFNIAAAPKHIRNDSMDHSRLRRIDKRDMTEIHSAKHVELKVYQTKIIFLDMRGIHTHVVIGVPERARFPVFLEARISTYL